MKKFYLVTLLFATGFAAACESDAILTPGPIAHVRVLNAMTGGVGALAFVTNGELIGSVQNFASVSACADVPSGQRTLAVGPANAAGTGILGNAFATEVRSLPAGGDFTFIASGTDDRPGLQIIDNKNFDGILAAGQAAIRFINLVPDSAGASVLDVFVGNAANPTLRDNVFGLVSGFVQLPAGTNTFTVRESEGTFVLVNAAPIELPAGSLNTVAVLPNATGTGNQLVRVTSCT